MLTESEMPHPPFRFFPVRIRKYVRLPAPKAYESILSLLREEIRAKKLLSSFSEETFVEGKIGRIFGATVKVKVIGENEVTDLDITFLYRSTILSSLLIFAAVLGIEIALGTVIPDFATTLLTTFAFAIIFLSAYKANSSALKFLNILNETLPHVEREYARMVLIEERKRWQLEKKDVDALYRRLCEKHVKTWGNIRVLEYKVAEYMKQGLTREEAIIKTAEEEGIY